jgi:sarcosine oxidase gamma subunit
MTPRRERGDARESELPFEQLMAEYKDVLRNRVQDHAQLASDITRNYKHHIQSWLNGDQPRDLDSILRDPQAATDDNLRTTDKEVSGDIKDFHERFVQVIPPEDQGLWRQIQDDARQLGPDTYSVRSALQSTSSRESQAAMNAALDQIIWEQIKSDAKNLGPDTYSVRSALQSTSSRESQAAMERQLGDMVSQDSSRSRSYERGYVFEEEDLFRNRFGKDGFGGGFFHDSVREEARKRAGQRGRQRSTGNQHRQQARQEAPRRNNLDIEAEQIIQKVVASDRQAGWLTGAKRGDIKRVISTVRAIRQKAAEKGEEATDRHIYLRYRRLLERDDVNPQTEESFKILAAMMGNNPKGTLPF